MVSEVPGVRSALMISRTNMKSHALILTAFRGAGKTEDQYQRVLVWGSGDLFKLWNGDLLSWEAISSFTLWASAKIFRQGL